MDVGTGSGILAMFCAKVIVGVYSCSATNCCWYRLVQARCML